VLLKKLLAGLLAFLLLAGNLSYAGLGSHSAMYVGGTAAGLSERTEGRFSTTDNGAVFQANNASLTIPYAKIDSLEYGEKAGRRVGLAVVVSPLFLLSKKRRHYLTIGYLDDQGEQQAAVLELGKDIIQPSIHSLETKTGKKVEYQDDEARKVATGK
jgi:hypothetical protein